MITIGLIIGNKKEASILKGILEPRKINVRLLPTTATSYRQAMTLKPDLIIIEITQKYVDQLACIQLFKENKQLKQIPILCYGIKPDKNILTRLVKWGMNKYYLRPLKMAVLFKGIQDSIANADLLADVDLSIHEKKNESSDSQILLDPNKLNSEKIRYMVDHVGKLLAFPFSVTKITAISNDGSAGADELAKVIKSDSAISTDILRISNSVIFASRDRKIVDIKESIVRVGFEETKKIALGLKVLALTSTKEKKLGFDREDFWYFSLGTALIAEKFANHLRFKNPSLAFLCGLLHGIGTLVLDEFFEDVFVKILEENFNNPGPISEAEKKVMGFSQNMFVEALFEKWNLPPDLISCIKLHSNFEFIPEMAPDDMTLILCVGMAVLVAKSANLGHTADAYVYPLMPSTFDQLKMPMGLKNAFFSTIYQNLFLFASGLKLPNRMFPEKLGIKIGSEPMKLGLVRDPAVLFEPHLFFLEHTVEQIIRYKDIEEFEKNRESNPPHLLVISLSESLGLEQATAFIQRCENQNAAITGQGNIIPVLLFYNRAEEIEFFKASSDNVRLLPKALDLKVLHTQIEEMVSHHTVAHSS